MGSNQSENPKNYICSWEGCGKSFTRSDHLQRHALNHASGDSTCHRCSLHFKRPDLLARHLLRHKQKDEEAGGEGLGVVESRKRLWRDSDGNIVSKRPTLSSRSSASDDNHSSNLESSTQQDILDNLGIGTDQNLPEHQLFEDLDSEAAVNMTMINGTEQDITSAINCLDMVDFLANASWGTQPQNYSVDVGLDIPYDDIFQPDTASSFNMPFTTMSNYNWLFDRRNAPSSSSETGHKFNSPIFPDHSQSKNRQRQSKRRGPNLVHAVEGFERNSFRDTWQNNQLPPQGRPSTVHAQSHHSLSQSYTESGYHSQSTMSDNSTSPRSNTGSHHDSTSSLHSYEDFNSDKSPPTVITEQTMHITGDHQTHKSSSGSAAFNLHIFHQKYNHELPTLDENCRIRILNLLGQTNSTAPGAMDLSSDNPLLSLISMQQWCDLFFTHFNTCYPLIHQPTFNPSNSEPLLLLAILLLGATYSDKQSHRLAVCIHELMRSLIFQHQAFNPQPDLWILQTILLVECFGKSRAGQRQHDMAHLFHGLLVNLIRRSDCQNVRQLSLQEDSGDIMSLWLRAVELEQRKRLAFLCFLWDTQHAVLFSQSLCISAFELRTVLPWNPSTWEANSAEEWLQHYRNEIQIPFLPVLKAYINPGSRKDPPQLNSFSWLLVLHGLMSIQWDFRRRDQTSLGVSGCIIREKQSWQVHLAQSYDAWKADFDTFCMNMTLSLHEQTSRKNEFKRFSTSTNSIYHAAQIVLNIEILDLQIYAGARHIIGRQVTRGDYERSRRIIKCWATPGISNEAPKAAWHGAQLLRDGIMNLDRWNVDNAFHYPWCLYLATLACWAFNFAVNDNDENRWRLIERSDSHGLVQAHRTLPHDQSFVCDERVEMTTLVSSMSNLSPDRLWGVAGKYSTSGLIVVMAQHLGNIRWAVIHEAMKVLKGMVEYNRN